MNSKRKLASIQIISNIENIPDANVIRKASVLGWKTVIKEGQFQIGDKCIFVEIDSVFPDRPEFADFLKRGNRLKSIKLKSQISQGVCLPLSLLPVDEYNVGDDVTEILGITKYDPPIPAQLSGMVKGNFPSFCPKTDENRIQSCSDFLDRYKNQSFYISEKCDGSSVSFIKHENNFGVCSRNLELKETEDNTLWKLARKYNIENKLPNGFALQCEVIGEGIQKNPLKLKGQDIYIFYVFDIIKYQYLNLDDMVKFVNDMGLKTVPIIDTNFILNHSVEQIIEMANGNSLICKDSEREGLVFRLNNNTDKISFKSISNKYLLKYDQ